MNSQVQNELQAEILFYYPPRYLNVANCMQERYTIYMYISDRQFVLVALYLRGSHKVDEWRPYKGVANNPVQMVSWVGSEC